MASGTHGEFYCGTYIRGRIRYETVVNGTSGHIVKIWMDVYRTNASQYHGDIANNRQTDTITVDGQTSSWYNTTISAWADWHNIFYTEKTITHTAAKEITISWATDCEQSYYNGSTSFKITLEALGSPASGLWCNFVSATWDSIVLSGGLSSWGQGSGNGYVALAIMNKNRTTWGGGRREWTASNQKPAVIWSGKTLDNNSVPLEGGIAIKGCLEFKYGLYADNGYQAASVVSQSTAWTPPAPLNTLSVLSDDPFNAVNTQVVFRAVGSAANNVSGQLVLTQYRYSTDNGSTFTNWTDVSATAQAPGTALDITLTLPQNAQVVIEVRQYQTAARGYSEVKQLSYLTKMAIPVISDYHWDDVRRRLVITAEAGTSRATATDILWGYTDQNMSVLASAQGGTVTGTIADPNHGTTRFLYIQARAKYVDNTYKLGQIILVQIPNPILGVLKENNLKYWVVDIIEHKSDNTITPAWQNGTRVVVK